MFVLLIQKAESRPATCLNHHVLPLQKAAKLSARNNAHGLTKPSCRKEVAPFVERGAKNRWNLSHDKVRLAHTHCFLSSWYLDLESPPRNSRVYLHEGFGLEMNEGATEREQSIYTHRGKWPYAGNPRISMKEVRLPETLLVVHAGQRCYHGQGTK